HPGWSRCWPEAAERPAHGQVPRACGAPQSSTPPGSPRTAQPPARALATDSCHPLASRFGSVHPLRYRLRQIVHSHGVAGAAVVTSNDIEILESHPVGRTVALLGGD